MCFFRRYKDRKWSRSKPVVCIDKRRECFSFRGNAEHEKILQLAGKGLGAEAIAKRVGKPVGEVALILNLEKLSSAS